MDVEALAVAEINRLIGLCPRLKPYILSNDKTPFTDGHIDLYAGLRRSKDEWQGRVSVQVKGRSRRAKKRRPSTYRVCRTDLLAYQKDSGVLYFYVAVDESGSCNTYYALLSPVRIKWLLDSASDGQDPVPVGLTELSSDLDRIERLVDLALKTREQNPAMGFDPVLLQRAKSFSVQSASPLNFDAPLTLAPGSDDFALVLNTIDGLSIPLSGELHVYPASYIKQRIDLQVRSGKATYERPAVRQVDQELFEIEISSGLRLHQRNGSGERSTEITLTMEKMLTDRIKSLEFYIAILDTKLIEIGGQTFSLETQASEQESELRGHLKALRQLMELFECLSVDSRLIDLTQVTSSQMRQLRILHRAFVLNEEISGVTPPKSWCMFQPIGQWNLMFLILQGSASNKWRLVDPFSPETRRQYWWAANVDGGQEQAIPVTAYDILTEANIGTVLNMRLDTMVSAYQAISDFDSTYTEANQRVVMLIAAADESDRREELLDAAATLNDWLIAEQGDELRHRINRWQILARRDALSLDERNAIRKLKREMTRSSTENARQFELACAILLQDWEEVGAILGDLPEDQAQQMQKWPIWRLYDSPALPV